MADFNTHPEPRRPSPPPPVQAGSGNVAPPQGTPSQPIETVAVQNTAVHRGPIRTAIPAQRTEERPARRPEVRLYSHSALFYWWPVWVMGYVMALVTYLHGQPHQI